MLKFHSSVTQGPQWEFGNGIELVTVPDLLVYGPSGSPPMV